MEQAPAVSNGKGRRLALALLARVRDPLWRKVDLGQAEA